MSFRLRNLRGSHVVLLAVLLLVAVPVPAMQQARSLRGVVTGTDGKPARGAVVKLKNRATLRIRSFITQKDGYYRFFRLNRDIEYEVWASYQGASSDVKTLSKFNSEKASTIDLMVKK